MQPTADISRTWGWVLLLALMVGSASLSVLFTNQSLRLDEAQSLWQIARPPAEILGTIAKDVHVPLYHELLRAWQIVTGNSVDGARLLSRLFLVATLPALYALGSYAYSRTTALFATLLLALSPFMNWYGDEIRMYTLLCFLAVLNQYFFLRLMREGRGSGGYFITALLGAFTHYFFFLVLGTQALFFFARRSYFPFGTFKRLFLSWVLVGCLFVPWVVYVLALGQIGNQIPALTAPSTVDLFNAFSQFFFGFQSDAINTFLLSLWPILITLAFFAMRESYRMRLETEYLLLSAAVPILMVFFVSLFFVPLFASRYLIFTVPALFLLTTDLFTLYPRALSMGVRIILVALMAGTLGVEVVSAATPVKEDYRDATLYLNAHAAAQDTVVLSAPFTLYPVEYYYRGEAQLATLPVWNQYAYGAIPGLPKAELPSEAKKAVGNSQNIWLLLSYDQGHNAEVKQYFDTHYQRTFAQTFSPGLDLYEYQARYDTALAHISAK